MKTEKNELVLRSTLMAVLACLAAQSIEAADARPTQRNQPVGHIVRGRLSKCDKNRNSKIDPAEWDALLRDKIKEHEEYWKHKEAEAKARKAASQPSPRKYPPGFLEKYDRNKNGRLEPHEWERHRADFKRLQEEKMKGAAPVRP